MPTDRDILQYLARQGLDKNHALGIVANLKGESGFNPAAVGDQGTSFGLAQWHKDRGEAMRNFVGPNWQQDWRGQLDFLIQEGETRPYLQRQFDTPQDASRWFTVNWERPANAAQKAEERLTYFGNKPMRTDTARTRSLLELVQEEDNPGPLLPQGSGLLDPKLNIDLRDPRFWFSSAGAMAQAMAQNPNMNPFGAASVGLDAAYRQQEQLHQQAIRNQLLRQAFSHREADQALRQRKDARAAAQQKWRRELEEKQLGWAEEDRQAARESDAAMDQARQMAATRLRQEGNLEGALLVESGAADNMLGQMVGLVDQPEKMTSAIQNFEYMIGQGIPEADAVDKAFGKGGTVVNVGSKKFGSVPGGAVREGEQIKYLPGSEKELELKENIRKIRTVAGDVDKLWGWIDEHGSEMGGETAGRMANTYNEIQTAVRLAQEMGAPQAAELEILRDQLPDPTSIGANLNPFFKRKAKGAYDTLRKRLGDMLTWSEMQYSQNVKGAGGQGSDDVGFFNDQGIGPGGERIKDPLGIR